MRSRGSRLWALRRSSSSTAGLSVPAVYALSGPPWPGRLRTRPSSTSSTSTHGSLGHRVPRVVHDRSQHIDTGHDRAATPGPDALHRSGSLRGEPVAPPPPHPLQQIVIRATQRGAIHRQHSSKRRPLRHSINVTLDGCCDHEAIPADEDLHRHAVQNLDQAHALLSGRETYELTASAGRAPVPTGARPGRVEPFAQRIDAAKKYVVSSTLE